MARHRAPQGVQMQQESLLGDESAVTNPGAAKDEPQPLPGDEAEQAGAFPYDGAPVDLSPDGKHWEQAVRRRTRAYDREQMKWIDAEFWAKRNGGGRPINFQPAFYRLITE